MFIEKVLVEFSRVHEDPTPDYTDEEKLELKVALEQAFGFTVTIISAAITEVL